MKNYVSPRGAAIVAVAEIVKCTVGIVGINDDGTPEYDSNGATVDWDSQVPQRQMGEIMYLCEDGHLWRFNNLVVATEDEDDDDAGED